MQKIMDAPAKPKRGKRGTCSPTLKKWEGEKRVERRGQYGKGGVYHKKTGLRRKNIPPPDIGRGGERGEKEH